MMDHDTDHRIQLNKDNLARVIGFVSVIDAKAQFVLTLILALTGFLSTQFGSYLDAHQNWHAIMPWGPALFILLDLVAITCIGLFLRSAIHLLKTITPRTHQHTGSTSPLFYGTIATMPHERFKETMTTVTPEVVVGLLSDQTYDNAKIVAEKTACVKRSVTLFLWGTVCFFVFITGRAIIISTTGH